MLCFQRPAQPDGFAEDVRAAQAKIQQAIAEGKKPKIDDPRWRRYKRYFEVAQFGKCGYCELDVSAGQYGDVEHYRPKSQVSALREPGHHEVGVSAVQGRTYTTVCETGYWWLAYAWDNYLLACQICNQSYKNALFPIQETRHGVPTPGGKETPLLIHPFEPNPLSEYLVFGDLGQISARNGSRIGRQTIDTCGLDRVTLRRRRLEKFGQVRRLIARYLSLVEQAAEHSREGDQVLRDLAHLGNEAYLHAGMVRVTVVQQFDVAWAEFMALVEMLPE